MHLDRLSGLDCNNLDAYRIFMGGSETGEYREHKRVAVACCGLPVLEFNWGFLKPPYDDLHATAATVRSYFENRKLPFRLTFRHLERQHVEKLEGNGWQPKDDPTPGMTLTLPGSPSARTTALAILSAARKRLRRGSHLGCCRWGPSTRLHDREPASLEDGPEGVRAYGLRACA
jgi:hypothetical protein